MLNIQWMKYELARPLIFINIFMRRLTKDVSALKVIYKLFVLQILILLF